ncbi:MAG: hypothetical protein EOT04_02705 [Candidatus Chaera renei]|uniref:Uncharacterized protein n=1 Tax=Candidatus Chaera renei TaxID=2506947 RepID=A0A4Q0AGP3_9BACT|nr:MAG: hypothetical protein EOT04_02705 [Candidatus Chaera renei]
MNLNRRGSLTKKLLLAAAALLLLGALGGTWYFYNKYQQLRKNPSAAVQADTKALVDRVGKLMELPTGETPTIATIQDKDKLKDQPFFKDAQNGDKILIYAQAKKAIIFRESNNKIINVGPIAINDTSQTTPPPSAAPAPTSNTSTPSAPRR